MKKVKIIYYILENIREGSDQAFEATIPVLNHGIVFGSSIQEIEAGIKFGLENEKISYEKLVCCQVAKTSINQDHLRIFGNSRKN